MSADKHEWTAAEMGRKGGKIGGKAKVTKGFGKATPEQRREWGLKGWQTRKKRASETSSEQKTPLESET